MSDKQQFLRGLNYALGKVYIAKDAATPYSKEWHTLKELATSIYAAYERFEKHGTPDKEQG